MKIGGINYYIFVYKSKENKQGKAPIYCRLTYLNQCKMISSGVFINPQSFSPSDQNILGVKTIESRALNAWKTRIENHLLKSCISENDISLYTIVRGITRKAGKNNVGSFFGILGLGRFSAIHTPFSIRSYKSFRKE